jgi:two-component system CheB/CheR fusion protein
MPRLLKAFAAQGATNTAQFAIEYDSNHQNVVDINPIAGSGHEKICVVDDDYFSRDGMCGMLHDFGWDVCGFSSCEEFLSAHRSDPATCLVLDIHFPGMSGLDLLRHMIDAGDGTPVVVVSGSSGINEAVRSMKKGAVDFIEKPVARDLLVDGVKRALALSRKSDEISAARNAAVAHLKGLTARQLEIMALVLAGHPSKNIAADLGINQRTVENHRAAIMKRTGARSLPALAQLAMSTRWTPDR